MMAYLPPEPKQLGWRDTFWRLCAQIFVRRRLRRDKSRAAELHTFIASRRNPD